MSVNWVACGTCYTKTEGTELDGVELQPLVNFSSKQSFRPFEGSPRGPTSSGPLGVGEGGEQGGLTRSHVKLFCNVLSRFEDFYFFKLY